MKWIFYCLILFGIDAAAQTEKLPPAEDRKINELSEVIVNNEFFSGYIRESDHPDPKVRNLQDAFIAYDLGRSYRGYDKYLVKMTHKDASLVATYDANGKLISVVEKYENVYLPTAVIHSVYQAFPGWQMVNDKYFYTQKNGDVKKNQYNIKLVKAGDSKKIVVKSNGEILASL